MPAVATLHRDYAGAKYKKIRTAVAGEDAIKAAGERFLPRVGEQTQAEYNAYLARAEYYGVSGRALNGLTGVAVRKPPTIEYASAKAKARLETNIDNAGTPALLQFRTAVSEVLQMGRFGLLADAVIEDGPAAPFLKGYAAERITNWETVVIQGHQHLAMVALEEDWTPQKPGDRFTRWLKTQYRTLTLENFRVDDRKGIVGDAWVRVYRKPFNPETGEDEAEDWMVVEERPLLRFDQPLDFIPFTFIGSLSLDPAVQKAPLLDLVNVNIHHYRLSAELNHGLFLTSMPQPVITGVREQAPGTPGAARRRKWRTGTNTAWVLGEPGADAKYLEYTGNGLQHIADEMVRDEGRMVLLGARLLEPQKRAAETAEALRLRQAGESATLATVANAVGMGMQQALNHVALWAGDEPTARVSVSTDFTDEIMPVADMLGLGDAYESGWISEDDLHHNLERGERLAPGTTAESWRRNLREGQLARLRRISIGPAGNGDGGGNGGGE